MSAVPDDVLEGGDLVALHRRLQRVDRVDLGDDDPRALAGEALGAALAHVAVAEHDRRLAADHHVGGPVDAVDQRVAAAVEVVELALGHRVVDVDGREQQLAPLHHLVEPVHAGGGLLGDALDAGGHARPLRRVVAQAALQEAEHDGELGARTPSSGRAPRPPARTRRPCAPAAWRRHRRRGSCSGRRRRLRTGHVIICSVHHQYSSSVSPFQANTGMPCGSSGVPFGPTATAAAAWSWVEKMLHDAQRTSAPSSTSVSMSTAVWIVMCSEPEMRAPASGLAGPYSLRRARRPGISCSARWISRRPNGASERSATRKSWRGRAGASLEVMAAECTTAAASRPSARTPLSRGIAEATIVDATARRGRGAAADAELAGKWRQSDRMTAVTSAR